MEGEKTISHKRMVTDAIVHHIPCEIAYNGSAPISSYFVINDDNKIKEATFRGRLLKGERIELPDTIQGMTICKGKTNEGKESYECIASFNEMTEWNTDKDPIPGTKSSMDNVIDLMQILSECNEIEE